MLKDEYHTLTRKYTYIRLGNFLDAYYRADKKEKERLFKKEPKWGSRLLKKYKSYLVSSFMYLCEKDSIKIPSWMLNDKFILKEPFFTDEGCNDDMKGYLLANSPSCYRLYNIYTERKPLRRC